MSNVAPRGMPSIPFVSSLLASRGHRTTFVVMGIVQGVVIFTMAQFLRHPPAEAVVAKPTQGAAPQVGKRQFTTLEMLRTPQFYVMYTAMVLMSVGGLLVTANAGPMSRSWGLPAAALTLAATLSPIANGGSRIFWGWVSDRMGRENTMVVAFLFVFFGIRAYRDEIGGGVVTFGRAFKVGILIVAIASLCYVLTWEILYFNVMGPDFNDKLTASMMAKEAKSGATPEQLAAKRAEMDKMMTMYQNPLINSAMTLLEVFPVGLIMTAISAAILRRRPGDGALQTA
jgi:hypothetical protein